MFPLSGPRIGRRQVVVETLPTFAFIKVGQPQRYDNVVVIKLV
jgi:hypothetical protein